MSPCRPVDSSLSADPRPLPVQLGGRSAPQPLLRTGRRSWTTRAQTLTTMCFLSCTLRYAPGCCQLEGPDCSAHVGTMVLLEDTYGTTYAPRAVRRLTPPQWGVNSIPPAHLHVRPMRAISTQKKKPVYSQVRIDGLAKPRENTHPEKFTALLRFFFCRSSCQLGYFNPAVTAAATGELVTPAPPPAVTVVTKSGIPIEHTQPVTGGGGGGGSGGGGTATPAASTEEAPRTVHETTHGVVDGTTGAASFKKQHNSSRKPRNICDGFALRSTQNPILGYLSTAGYRLPV